VAVGNGGEVRRDRAQAGQVVLLGLLAGQCQHRERHDQFGGRGDEQVADRELDLRHGQLVDHLAGVVDDHGPGHRVVGGQVSRVDGCHPRRHVGDGAA
jgi:hypothetical protein